MVKMQKQIIPYAELLEKIRGILASFPEECRNIHINGIQTYAEQSDGANWHINWVRVSGSDHDLSECRKKIGEQIRILREHYDVEERKR